MIQILSMAFRDLGRNRRRSFFSSLAVGMGLAMLMLLAGFLNGEMGGALDTAIRLLAEFAGPGGQVAERDLVGLVQRSRKPAPWDLTDAIQDRDLARALRIASRELDDAKDPKGEAIVLFHRIMRQVRTLRATQALLERNARADEAMERLGIKHSFPWEKAQRGAARYRPAELDAFLREALDAETRLKRGHAGPEALVTDLLARLIGGGAGGRAPARRASPR